MTPSSSTPSHLQNLKISWLDQFLSPHNYLPFIFYFPSNGDENNVERSRQLRNSLSETLTIFYPLAGRYTDNNLIIHCNDEGVEYTEAQHPVQPDNSPLVLIQSNIFESGGVAIGLCVTHRAADAYTVFTFVRTWASTPCPNLVETEGCCKFQCQWITPADTSRVDVTAVIWKTLAMVARAKHEDDGSKVQLHDFVDRVCNGIKKMVSDCAKVSSDDELFVMAEKIRIESIKAFTRSEMDLYMFNSWC
ncbi:hypothetical protein OIU76_022545 [Salix suchowensis]|nr:hypothetical protein OIU76_022545 [Salix suchowensis]